MRTIIAGPRSLGYESVIKAVANCGWIPTAIISGGASGVDQSGERYARENSIPLEIYQANWRRYGRSAGYVRNSLMADKAGPEGALICCWDGISKGSKNMLETARRKGLKIYLFNAEAMQT